MRSGDVIEDQFIRTVIGIVFRKGNRIIDIPQTFKVCALYDPSVPDVETGNNPFRDHKRPSAAAIPSSTVTAPVYIALPRIAP